MTGPQPRFSNTLHEYLHSKILTNMCSASTLGSEAGNRSASQRGCSRSHQHQEHLHIVLWGPSDVTPQIQCLTAWLLPRWVEHSRDCWAFLASRGFTASTTEVMCQLAFICLPTKWLDMKCNDIFRKCWWCTNGQMTKLSWSSGFLGVLRPLIVEKSEAKIKGQRGFDYKATCCVI